MEKKTVLAIVLSLVVWIGWTKFFSPKPPVPATNNEEPAVSENIKEEAKTLPKAKSTNIVKIAAKKKITNEVKSQIETPIYKVVLSNKGAKIESIKYGKKNIELAVGYDKMNAKAGLDFPIYFVKEDMLNGSLLDDLLWEEKKISDKEISYITLTELNGKTVQIEKTYTFTNEHYFDVNYKITNLSASSLSFPEENIYISSPEFLGPVMKNYEGYYNAPSSIYLLSDDDSLEKGTKGGVFGFAKMKEEHNPVWAGIMSRFISLVMLPQNFKAKNVIWDSREKDGFRTTLSLEVSNAEHLQPIEKKVRICLSEKKKDILVAIDSSLKAASDTSKWIEPIRVAVIWCLFWLNKILGNFGWAIVVFSIITKLIFLPLTIKSTNSMKKMSELAPKMNELKAQYKNDPARLQKETMELYKKSGANPLGGCLPLLIQMPFFFALYSALSNSIDMWQTPFFGWIKDLSMPDTVTQIMGINLNILPLLMTVTTIVQQKLTTVDSGNNSQKIMMMLMPIFMLYIFWQMPSGLVLYWTIQNALQIAHQYYVMKKPKDEAKA